MPITLANLTGEFLDLANLLADTDPANADAFTEIEECIERSAATIQQKAISIAAMIQEYEAAATRQRLRPTGSWRTRGQPGLG